MCQFGKKKNWRKPTELQRQKILVTEIVAMRSVLFGRLKTGINIWQEISWAHSAQETGAMKHINHQRPT